jgi:two-component system chemotaxis response regulator CheV
VSALIHEVDARTKLAGANRLELLLFHLASAEVFGINVFKVREVMKLPAVTRVPEADPCIRGMVNIRGALVPVIDLGRALDLGITPASDTSTAYLLVTEYNRSLQALLVSGVDRIVRCSWDRIHKPPRLVAETGTSRISAVATLDDGRTVLILDVEALLTIRSQPDSEGDADAQRDPALSAACVLFADDSSVARSQIRRTLDRLGIGGLAATTGKEAWEILTRTAAEAEQAGRTIEDRIQLVLSDIEMPEMDGFTLTKLIRSDPRLMHLPVVLHSSLTGRCNRDKGTVVGATDYVVKFDPKCLGDTIVANLKVTRHDKSRQS